MGHETSGVVAATGPGVDQYRPGDRVTVWPLDPCGNCPARRACHSNICHHLKCIGIDTPGALRDLWTVPAHTLHRKAIGFITLVQYPMPISAQQFR